MDAIEYLKEGVRMCDELSDGCNCSGCQLSFCNNSAKEACDEFVVHHPEEAVRIVEEWSKAHLAMTNAMKFEEVFGHPENMFVGIAGDGMLTIEKSPWWSEPYKAPEE